MATSKSPYKLVFVIALAITAFAIGLLIHEFRSTTGEHLPKGGDFTLMSPHGPVHLHDFKGKGVVLYFGYTSCPEACPLALGRLSSIMKTLPQKVQDAIVPIFISVDSRSDTPEKADDYAKYFFPGAFGLTGTKAQIDKVVAQYGTSYSFVDDPESAQGYSISHGTNFYFINRQGKLVGEISIEAPEAEIVSELETISRERFIL